jgi:ankyrin repeat protein
MQMKAKQHPKWNEFVTACCHSESKAEYLLRCHPELLEARTAYTGETALQYLVIENCLTAVKFLVRLGADVNTRDCSGETPVLHAARLGHMEMVRFLLTQGADPDLQEISGGTPLHMVAKEPSETAREIAGMLIEAGADPTITDICGDTPADIAADQGNDGLGQVLRAAKSCRHPGLVRENNDLPAPQTMEEKSMPTDDTDGHR